MSHSHPSAPRILIVGAAYSGLYAALNLFNICDGKPHFPSMMNLTPVRVPEVLPQIKILDERDGIFHTTAIPLVHVHHSVVDHAWISYGDIPALKRKIVQILQGKVIEIDPLQKRAFWRGNKSPAEETRPCASTRQQYIQDAKSHIASIKDSRDNPVVVIGGGAVGTEFAAEIKHYHPEQRVILIHSRSTVLSNEPLPEALKENTLKTLKRDGVEIILEIRLQLSNGDELVAGHTIWATSRHLPRTDFLPPESLNENGFVKVLSTMQFCPTILKSSMHFVVGDIAEWPGIKRVGRALSMGQCAAVNIVKLMATTSSKQSKETEAFELQEYPYKWGMFDGPEVYKNSFGTDLGLSICWGILCLPLPVPAAS
ncbi:hypothetical protein VTN00DRAFT_5627 [Thermoascus crustaceus]|uniref:uncharacterized protein n=1 Tax=Thermoascus crustaceus TaxID=5088 RepID=UPI0037444903